MDQVPNNAGKVAEILDRNHLKVGFGAMDAMTFVPSQPFHWIGLAVVRQRPVLWLPLMVFAVFTGWVAYDIAVFALWNNGQLLTAEPRLVLLPKMLAVAKSLPTKNMLVAALIAAIPVFFLGNVVLAVACGVITRQRPSWRWLLAGFLGAVPLRFIADYFMPKWKFWGGERRGVMSIEARMLQFSVIYGLVCGLSKAEVETLWVRVFDARLKEVFDSLYSYAYVAPLMLIGIHFGLLGFFTYFPYAISRPVMIGLESIEIMPLFSMFFIWLALNRFLLASTVFTLLKEPNFGVTAGNRWARLSKMMGVVVMMFSVMYAAIFMIGGLPKETLDADGLSAQEFRRFFSRIQDGPGVFNGFRNFATLRYCFDDNRVLKGVLAEDQVAGISGGQLRYLPTGTPAQLGCQFFGYEPVFKD